MGRFRICGITSDVSEFKNQAARMEKTMGNVRDTITRNAGNRREKQRARESEELIMQEFRNEFIVSQSDTANLHSTASTQVPVGHNASTSTQAPEGHSIAPISTSVYELLQLTDPILASVAKSRGDFNGRRYDTRTKQRPTGAEIKDVNAAVSVLLKHNTIPDPAQDPFGYLWIVNCILYSVIVAFYISKDWKKVDGNGERTGKPKRGSKAKEEFEAHAREIRGKLSKAKAEIERLKSNKKITKKGKKNRLELLRECKTLSVAILVAYMEKQKSRLRKVKRGYWRRKKQEDARRMNAQFELDPGRVYSDFRRVIDDHSEVAKPKYVHEQEDNESQRNVFSDAEEATTFWRTLWEAQGTGNVKAEWLDEVRDAIREKVPVSPEKDFELSAKQAEKVIMKKRNWSALGPDRIVNFWWKRANCLHVGIVRAFQVIAQSDQDVPLWFTEGRTSLIPKPGEFSSENQRPITCLNTVYKWFSSCLLEPVNSHLEDYDLMEGEQRGAKEKCSGTTDNLLIDRMVCQDSQRGRRNISMAWIDVRKAYDSVSHTWLREMFSVHRFPQWIGNLIERLSAKWNTRISIRTRQGTELSERILFARGLPQGDALCPKLFTLCMNPIAWKLQASEGYRLSKPINTKITDLLYVDDLKVYAASEAKLKVVLREVQAAMGDIGLLWNERKCVVVNVKRGCLQELAPGLKIDEQQLIKSLKEDSQYKFLGVLESIKQEDSLVLESAARVYLQRLSVIWSSPLSDHHKVVATNQFALPVLVYFMWTQVWPITELQRLDRESRKIMVENGGKHPLGTSDLLYLPRKVGGRGLKSIEAEYKLTKVKAAVRLYNNSDPTMQLVRQFEEKARRTGRHSLIGDAQRFAEELGMKLELRCPDPSGTTEQGEVIEGRKIGVCAKKAVQSKRFEDTKEKKWQGKLMMVRWEDEKLDGECFSWMTEWRAAPTHTIAGKMELYEQLLPTKLYNSRKTKTTDDPDARCRLCGKAQESVAHVLSGFSVLAQTKYLSRHNAALKILFFELLKSYQLKPSYENEQATVYWDVPVYADHIEVHANRVDARIVDKENQTVILLEMSCPWVENREQKEKEKTLKYAPLRLELKQQYPGYRINQVNIIIDVLGGYSKELYSSVRDLLGAEQSRECLRRMQKSVLSSSLNIVRSFKVLS